MVGFLQTIDYNAIYVHAEAVLEFLIILLDLDASYRTLISARVTLAL